MCVVCSHDNSTKAQWSWGNCWRSSGPCFIHEHLFHVWSSTRLKYLHSAASASWQIPHPAVLSALEASCKLSCGWTSASSGRLDHSRSPGVWTHTNILNSSVVSVFSLRTIEIWGLYTYASQFVSDMLTEAHHFTDRTSLLGSFLSTGGAELCVHEANLTCDGLSQHRQSCGVVTLRWQEVLLQNISHSAADLWPLRGKTIIAIRRQ